LFDEAYVEVHSEIKFPRIIAPWPIQPKRDNYGRVTGFVQVVHKKVDLSLDEVVHLKTSPWFDFAYPPPKLQTLYRTLMVKREAELFYYQILMRKGVPAKYFVYKGQDDETFDYIVKQIKNSKPGDTVFLRGDWEVGSLGNPVSDLKLEEVIDNCIQTIFSLFGIPRIILGYTEAATLETSRNQIVVFQQRIKDIQFVISAGLTEAFKRILGLDGFWIELIEWTNPEQTMRMVVSKLQAGIISIDEAREELGYDRGEEDYTSIPIPPGARGDFLGLEVQETLARVQNLLEQSRRAFPEKAFEKAWGDKYDRNVLEHERKLGRELRKFFRQFVSSEKSAVELRKEYGAQIEDLLRYYITRAAVEGVLYIDEQNIAPPHYSVIDEIVRKLLPTFVDDFWLIIADKKAGLAKPSKPHKDYRTLLKQDWEEEEEEELDEEDLYPPQRLNYENRLNLLASTLTWLAFNGAIFYALSAARKSGEIRDVLVKWVAKEDEKTCESCRAMDGKIFTLDELMFAGALPPIHPNCRCRLIALRR